MSLLLLLLLLLLRYLGLCRDSRFGGQWNKKYPKSSIKPPGGLFNFGPSRRGGLIERGAYSQNQVKRIYLVAFQFYHPIFCRQNQHAILRLKRINSTQFLS